MLTDNNGGNGSKQFSGPTTVNIIEDENDTNHWNMIGPLCLLY